MSNVGSGPPKPAGPTGGYVEHGGDVGDDDQTTYRVVEVNDGSVVEEKVTFPRSYQSDGLLVRAADGGSDPSLLYRVEIVEEDGTVVDLQATETTIETTQIFEFTFEARLISEARVAFADDSGGTGYVYFEECRPHQVLMPEHTHK
jgi:hypothetical protein